MTERDSRVLAALERLAVDAEVCAYLEQIAKTAGCSKHSTQRALSVLVDAGVIRRNGRRGNVAVFVIEARSCSDAKARLASEQDPLRGPAHVATPSSGDSAAIESASADPAELAAEAERIKQERERDELLDRPLSSEERAANLERAEGLMFRFGGLDVEPVAVGVGVCDDFRPYSRFPDEAADHGEPANVYQLGPGRYCRGCFSSRLKAAQRYQPDIVADLIARARRADAARA